jgi:hypothetical protein
MMSARVALVPRPRSSIISTSFACEIRDGGWVSLSTIQGSPSSSSCWPSSQFGISSSEERA